jgi:hypothetical protein
MFGLFLNPGTVIMLAMLCIFTLGFGIVFAGPAALWLYVTVRSRTRALERQIADSVVH